jgi:hypothetical protein
MIESQQFAQRQLQLTAEFGKYVIDHPEVDDLLPPESYIYFEVAGEEDFNRYGRQLAEKRQREARQPVICVRVKGLAPPQGSRLIDPVIEPISASA